MAVDWDARFKNYIDCGRANDVYLNEVLLRAHLANNRGASGIKTLFWVLVLVSVVYGAYKAVPPYFSYYMIKTDIEDEAKNAHMYSDRVLLQRILQKARTWEIPIGEDNIEIKRGYTSISVEVNYTQTIEFIGGYRKVIPVNISTVQPLKEPEGVLH